MSHELRTPLNAIINFTQFVADPEYGGELSEERQQFLNRVLFNSEHLLGLINDILDLSKIEAGKMELVLERCDLYSVLHGVMATAVGLTADKGLTLTLDAPELLPVLCIDKQRVRQVLLNLLSNAAKFTKEGGIVVQVRETGDGFVRIVVSDTGIGIPLESQALIFEEFRQLDSELGREYQGTGLGLPISKKLIALHGGTMGLESTPGYGSSFWFTLPLQGTESASPQPIDLIPAVIQQQDNHIRVAVIDDDPDAQIILAHLLHEAGYSVMPIQDSRMAIERLRAGHPTLILLDIQMPHLNGWDLLAQIQQDPQLARIPVILCTIVDIQRSQLRILPSVRGYTQKPIRQEEVLLLFKQYARPHGSRILIVDDAPDARQLLRILLERQGYHIEEAANGLRALESMRKNRPDLVVLDLMMPGMDGFQVLLKMERDAALADLPVIVLTAKELDAAERTWLSDHTTNWLTKTTPSALLIQTIEATIERIMTHVSRTS
jgi:CheY-like chemotaxis protein